MLTIRSLRRLAQAAIALAAGLALTLPLNAAPAWATSYAKPTGLKATAVSSTAVAISWKAVKNAPAYRVQFSAKSNMSGAKTNDVTTNWIEWAYLDPEPSHNSARLKPNTTYYFRVKVISRVDLSRDPKSLTSYSKTLKVKTSKSTGWPSLAPAGMKASAQSATSEYLSWNSRGPGVAYRVSYSTSAKLTSPSATNFTASGGVLTGLKAGTRYYYRVRVLSATAPVVSRSAYSAVKSFTTTTAAKAVSTPFKVATYNICSYVAGCWKYANWDTRVNLLAGNIAAQAPDILNLEESSRVTSLIETLNTSYGGSYALADSRTAHANLVYNSARFSLDGGDDNGGGNNGGGNDPAPTEEPTPTPEPVGEHTWSNNADKNFVWATLTDKLTGKRIFVVAPHFTEGDSGTAPTDRIVQAKEMTDLITANNVDKLPVIVAGDFNTSKRRPHHAEVYATMTGAGYIDSLGNPTDSRYPDAAALATHRIDVDYATANNAFDPAKTVMTPAPRSKWLNGYDIDYIWHTATIKVDLIQTVVNLDLNGRFTGTLTANQKTTTIAYPPSDHNMLVAWVHLT